MVRRRQKLTPDPIQSLAFGKLFRDLETAVKARMDEPARFAQLTLGLLAQRDVAQRAGELRRVPRVGIANGSADAAKPAVLAVGAAHAELAVEAAAGLHRVGDCLVCRRDVLRMQRGEKGEIDRQSALAVTE